MMGELDNQAETPGVAPTPEPPKRTSGFGWMRAALIGSLAVNLLVLGLVAGAVARHGRDGFRGGPDDVGFGPFTEALSEGDRDFLREEFFKRSPDHRDSRRAAVEGFNALLATLRAPEWNEAAVRAALAAQRARTEERIELGEDLLIARLGQMTTEERAAFADRIESAIRKFRGKH
ncbi:MAG: hypothetical protein RLZZ528_429 [Pseudomonadota bacterium]|jgi:uncharacterized membrane protein